MQDQRRRGAKGNVVDQAVEQSIQDVVANLPLAERIAFMRHLRERMGEILSTAPVIGPNAVEDMAVRARLAAAFNVKLPGE